VQPLYELTLAALEKLGAYRQRPDAQGFFMHLLSLIKSSEADCRDIASFIAYFDGLDDASRYVPGANADAVTVITEHSAKGLEYPCVIIPALGMDMKTSPQTDARIAYELRDDGIGLYRNGEKYARHSAKLTERLAREKQTCYREELNAVYVALTRAKEELYVAISPKYSRGKNEAAPLVAAFAGKSYGVIDAARKPAAAAAVGESAPLSSYAAWVDRAADEFKGLGPFTDDAARKAGVLVHRVLAGETIDDAAANDAARRVMTAPSCARFFAPKGRVRCEYEVCDDHGDLLRIDRVIETESLVTVVDFKSHKPEDTSAYRAQVQRYMRVLAALHPDKSVEGWLVYVNRCEAEEV
jgi:ATP-dependent helicase/nuclease subunit A